MASELSDIAEKGAQIFPRIIKGEIFDSEIARWVRNAKRAIKYCASPFSSGYYGVGIKIPMREYYSQVVDAVSERVKAMRNSQGEFNLEAAIGGFDLDSTETTILADFAKNDYHSPIDAERGYLEFMEKVKPHKLKSYQASIATGAFAGVIASIATFSLANGIVLAAAVSFGLMFLEARYSLISSSEANLFPNIKMRGFNEENLKKGAIAELMNPYRT